MQKVKLGEAPQHGAERDAIHVAVYPTCAAVKVYPGQHVGHGIDGATPKKKPIGIVDPFLNHPVMPGEKFWIVLFPDTARGLRHDWRHPSVDSEPVKLAGEAEVKAEFTAKGVVEKKAAPLSGAGQEVGTADLTKPRYARYASLVPPTKTPAEVLAAADKIAAEAEAEEGGVDGIPGWTQEDEDEHDAWCKASCPHEPGYVGPTATVPVREVEAVEDLTDEQVEQGDGDEEGDDEEEGD